MKNIIEKIKNFYFKYIVLLIYYIMNNLEKYVLAQNLSLKLARLFRKNSFEKAFYYYRIHFNLNNDDLNSAREFAQFLTDNNMVKQSENVCNSILINRPDEISILLIKCQNYIITKEYNKVIQLAETILSWNNQEYNARKFLCEAYSRLEMKEKLLQETEKIDLSRLSADTLVKLSRICLKEKYMEKGIKARNLFFMPRYFQEFTWFPPYIWTYYKKIWRGENLNNKTIFVFSYNYGGIGDYIMYSRYIPIIEKMAKKVIIQVNENLYDFYKFNFPNCEIILNEGKEFKGHYDYTCHNELFINLQKDLQNFPQVHFDVNPKLIQKFKETGLFNTNKLKVGLFYNSTSKEFLPERSIKTEEIIPILENKNCKFYLLDILKPEEETRNILQKYNVTILSGYIKNVNDTAAIMKNLDLVISTDSLCIHLAGSLLVKSFLTLNYENEWRWFYDTNKTPWYNSVTIFKQSQKNDWTEVIKRITREIEI